MYPSLVSDPDEAMYGLGIYGANYKIGILLLVFLQAFRLPTNLLYSPAAKTRPKAVNAPTATP